jgi:hypothetical protein
MRAHKNLVALALVAGAAVMTSSPDAKAAFAFLCNGIDANGNSSGDGCGACNASTAARWEVGTVSFVYDRSTLPGGSGGVSSSRWASEISQGRSSWNAVMGLVLADGGDATQRQFGVDNGENEIFWITNANEWNNKVGSGINVALGVTIASNDRAFCNGGRSIFDADLVMNGVGEFDWSVSSSLSTLTHEMGHAIGLGHPCINCGELMAAKSQGFGLDPDGPQAGDIQGIQQLYPAPGLVGSGCSSDGACDSGLCASVGGTSFCSQTCSGTCPSGMICQNVSGEGQICVFSSTEIALPGESCGPPGCVDQCDLENVGPGCNMCIPINQAGTESQCFKGCNAQTQQGCDSGAGESCETIFQNDNVSGVCVGGGGTALRGQTCDQNTGCVADLVCVLNAGSTTTGTCLAECDKTTGSGCFNTENCIAAFSDGSAACFPAGAGVDGNTCNDVNDCARGFLCNFNEGKCRARCDQGFSCSSADDTCTAVANALGSICVHPNGGEGEGEGEPPPPEGQCRIARGNFDCAPGDACELADPGDFIGTCTGREGDARAFEICSEDADCNTGLCESGVCIRPCDVGECPSGFECDESLAPAGDPATGQPGLCMPSSCANNTGICDAAEGLRCVTSPTGDSVCAKDGTPVGCFCGAGAASKGDVLAGVVALLALAGLSTRRGPRAQRRR